VISEDASMFGKGYHAACVFRDMSTAQSLKLNVV